MLLFPNREAQSISIQATRSEDFDQRLQCVSPTGESVTARGRKELLIVELIWVRIGEESLELGAWYSRKNSVILHSSCFLLLRPRWKKHFAQGCFD